ncbi:unnamed protein product, partial [Oppiella nova]
MKLLIVLALFVIAANAVPFAKHFTKASKGKNWILLCAGSNGWYNYADQAIVYKAWHLFRSYGIPEENIIIFHYDDIANNKANPTPGIVINDFNGTDVYKGVPKDYVGKDVTPKNFLGALQGDQELANQGKKVINSGPDDHIFAYFGDHGMPGAVMFATGQLYATDLNKALVDMHSKNKFAKLVFYIDTCESGSMFDKLLPANINIYAATSSTPKDPSYFWKYDKTYKTFLGAWFASYWLINDEAVDLDTENFDQQFKLFADRYNVTEPTSPGHKPHNYTSKINVHDNEKNYGAVIKWDVPLYILQRRISETNDVDEKNELTKELELALKGREYVDNVFNEYVNSIQHLMPNIATNAILHTKQEL